MTLRMILVLYSRVTKPYKRSLLHARTHTQGHARAHTRLSQSTTGCGPQLSFTSEATFTPGTSATPSPSDPRRQRSGVPARVLPAEEPFFSGRLISGWSPAAEARPRTSLRVKSSDTAESDQRKPKQSNKINKIKQIKKKPQRCLPAHL